MQFIKNKFREIKFSKTAITILVVIAACLVAILVVYELPLTVTLKEALYSSIVGSGFVGLIVSGAIYYVQENSEYQANKLKAHDFFYYRLIPDLKEIFKRSPSPWNLSGSNKFYFDDSYFNSLFDEFDKYFDNIFNYSSYFPYDQLPKTYYDFYADIREGYVLGEKTEGAIYQIVRAVHHQLNIDSINDSNAIMFTRASLISGMFETEILKYLSMGAKPGQYATIVDLASNNQNIIQWITDISSLRKKLQKTSDEIRSLTDKAKPES